MDEKMFYTLKGYELIEKDALTNSMEDYLEMLYRMLTKGEAIKITALAKHLNVRPSSASKMVSNLMEEGYLIFEKYGKIELTEKGKKEGEYLLYRHRVVSEFLFYLNGDLENLNEVEKIEHFFSKKTVRNLEILTEKLKSGL